MSVNTLSVIQNNIGDMLREKSQALPKNFNQTRFLQNCMTVLSDIQGIESIQPESIAKTMLKGAFLGLDFFNRECYAIPYNRNIGTKDRANYVKELQFQTDYKGEIKLAKKYSLKPIHDIYAKVVRPGDYFEEVVIGGMPSITFKPKPFNNSPDIIGVFAVCLYDDGTMIYDTMSVLEVNHIKERYSKTDRNNKYSKAWEDSWGEMAKKTVLRRLCKMIELDFDNIEQQKAWNDGSDVEFEVLNEVKPPVVMPKEITSKSAFKPEVKSDTVQEKTKKESAGQIEIPVDSEFVISSSRDYDINNHEQLFEYVGKIKKNIHAGDYESLMQTYGLRNLKDLSSATARGNFLDELHKLVHE